MNFYTIFSFIIIAVTILIIKIATIIISIYFVSSKIVTPLILLKNKVSEVGKGNYPSKINITSNDEVGVLVDSFNLMSEMMK